MFKKIHFSAFFLFVFGHTLTSQTNAQLVREGFFTAINLRDIGSGCGRSAIEATKLMPRWLPAEHNGQKVWAKGVTSVWFKLD